jgi:hypothetical protein
VLLRRTASLAATASTQDRAGFANFGERRAADAANDHERRRSHCSSWILDARPGRSALSSRIGERNRAMATSISKDSVSALTEVIGMIKLIDQMDKKIQSKYSVAYDGLGGAIKDESDDEIELFLPQLTKVVEDIDRCIHSIKGALGLLAQLRKDEALMESKATQINALLPHIVKTQNKLVGQLKDADKRKMEAYKAADAAKTGTKSALADLASLKDEGADLMKKVDSASLESSKLDDAARKAFGERNQKVLTETRLRLIALTEFGVPILELRSKVTKFTKQYPKLDGKMEGDVEWLLATMDRGDSTMKKINQIVKDLITLGQVKKADPVKAAAALKVSDKKDIAELSRILNQPQPDLEKALNALARKYKSTGSAWIALLERAGVI